jgi:DNA mismatch repair ATPase MutS
MEKRFSAQTETPNKKNKESKLIERKLTKVYTAGTLFEEAFIGNNFANYLLCFHIVKKKIFSCGS